MNINVCAYFCDGCFCVKIPHSDLVYQPSAQGADLTFAAAPLAAGIGQTHHNISAFSVSFAKGLQDLIGDERTRRPAEHSFLVVSGCCEAEVLVSLKKTFHGQVGIQTL